MMRWCLLLLVSSVWGASLKETDEDFGIQIEEETSVMAKQFLFKLQLQNYTNPGGLVNYPNGQPNATYHCTYTTTDSFGNQNPTPCNYYVNVGVYNPNGMEQSLGRPAFRSQSGSLNFGTAGLPFNQTQNMTFALKPAVLVISIFNAGQIQQAIGSSKRVIGPSSNNIVKVESFMMSMSSLLPFSSSNIGTNSVSMTNPSTGAVLTFNYAVQCYNNLLGPNCNLNCTIPTSANAGSAICYVQGQTTPQSCAKAPSPYQMQYTNCSNCANGGNAATGICNQPGQASTVSPPPPGPPVGGTNYKTATTVLAILFVLAGLVVIGLCVRMYMSKKRTDEAEYARRRAEWREQPHADLSKDNKAYSAKPDPDASSYTGSESGSATASEPGSHAVHNSRLGSIVGSHAEAPHPRGRTLTQESIGVIGPGGQLVTYDHLPVASSGSGSDSASEPEKSRTDSKNSAGRTTPRIEARV